MVNVLTLRSIKSWGLFKAVYTSSPARLVHSNTNSTPLGSIKPHCNYCSKTSHTVRLSELRRRPVNEIAKAPKRQHTVHRLRACCVGRPQSGPCERVVWAVPSRDLGDTLLLLWPETLYQIRKQHSMCYEIEIGSVRWTSSDILTGKHSKLCLERAFTLIPLTHHYPENLNTKT